MLQDIPGPTTTKLILKMPKLLTKRIIELVKFQKAGTQQKLIKRTIILLLSMDNIIFFKTYIKFNTFAFYIYFIFYIVFI